MARLCQEMCVNRSILNVCEDARIEKLICHAVSWSKQSFIKSYKDLLNRDFFGIKDLDTDLLKLIDRINLHTKCASRPLVSFRDEELPLLNEVMQTETWEEVVAVAKKIQDFMKEKLEEVKLKLNEDSDEDGIGDELDEESDERRRC
jgi:hypothetical protein